MIEVMLDNKDKKNPFTVPENYFQNFNIEIMEKLPQKEVTENNKIRPLWRSASKWISVAAVISGLAFVGIHYMDNNTGNLISSINKIESRAIESPLDIENDYYDFLQEEATRIAYKDSFYSDDL